MPSSISASEPLVAGPRAVQLRRATVVLLVGCLVIALGVEAAARFGLDRASRIQRRMVQEYAEAVAIGQDGTPGRHVLVVGNSLLDEGVRFEQLRGALADIDIRRYMVEQTVYYDWLYGLKRLYREGARPDVVVVMLGTGHWLSPNIRGDYSAQYMMSLPDLPAVARDLDMHPTQATGLLVAGVSKFWGARVEMRNFVLGHLMPDLATFMNASSAVDRRPMIDTDITPVLSARVARMRELTAQYGSRLVLLVPPMLNPVDGSGGLIVAATGQNVPVLRPVLSGSFGSELFRDGFHLNDAGAAAFTARIIPALQQATQPTTLRPTE